jgi:mono/diheme cytochrome c family protein
MRQIKAAGLIGAMLAPLALVVAPINAQRNEHAEGIRVYVKWCAPCHDPGLEHPGTLALTAKYEGRKTGVLLNRTDLPPEVTRTFVRTGISIMPFFRKTEISDAELDELAAYLGRNSPRPDD